MSEKESKFRLLDGTYTLSNNLKQNPDSSFSSAILIYLTLTFSSFSMNRSTSSFFGLYFFVNPYNKFETYIDASSTMYEEFNRTSTKCDSKHTYAKGRRYCLFLLFIHAFNL